jgi:hypothetical protein
MTLWRKALRLSSLRSLFGSLAGCANIADFVGRT